MPFTLAALIGLVLRDGPGCRFVNCSDGGTKTSFSSNELSFVTLVDFRFLGLISFDKPG